MLEFLRQRAVLESGPAHKNTTKQTAPTKQKPNTSNTILYPKMPPLSSFDTMEMHSSFTSLASTEDVNFDMGPKATKTAPQRSSIKKCLRFDMYDEVFEIPHIDDLSDDEVNATWYSKKEFQAIRRSCLRTVELMEQSGDEYDFRLSKASSKHCTRGLEKHTDLQRDIRKRQQEVCFEAVMAIQDLSDSRGIALNDIMAELYAQSCSNSVREAILVALQDAREVRSMMR
jgi:hypothetical protein